MQKMINYLNHWKTIYHERKKVHAMERYNLVSVSMLTDLNEAKADQQLLQAIRYEMMERDKSVTSKHKVICNLLGIKDVPKKPHPRNTKGRR